MECRVGCGACCIAASISTPIPGMPQGKPAGVRCIQLDQYNKCKLFGSIERPIICNALKASLEMCGNNEQDAIRYLTTLESLTKPC
jgi:Fe-S-cluster containining protein